MTSALFYLWLALVGLCAGSLLNVIIWRLPQMILQPERRGFNLWWPCSHCRQCLSPLRWYDNLPLLSWLLLRGHCRSCRDRISYRYPLVELGAMLLTLLTGFLLPAGAELLAALLLVWMLLALALIDIDHQLLPDNLTLPLLWLGLISQIWQLTPGSSLEEGVIGAVAGYLFLWLLAQGYRLWRRHEGLGMGDAKLLAALGAWLGWQALPTVLLLASLVGMITLALAHWLFRRPLHAPFPFGPGLAMAGAALYFLPWYSAML